MTAIVADPISARRRQLSFPSCDSVSAWYRMGDSSQTKNPLHPSEMHLAAFSLGRLDELRAAIVEQHVNECDRCASLIARVPGDEFIEQLQEAERSNPGAECTLLWRKSVTGASESISEIALGRLPSELHQHPRYRIIRLLAEGGMGTVYLAEHRIMRNLVALKTIKPELSKDHETIARFLQEARTAGQLDHSNIARVFDVEQVGETMFLTMEYVPGKTLAQIVAKRGPLPILHSCHYVRQIALGLDHACTKGVIHRDIKPQNVMLMSSNGIVKILDFGLGRLVDEQRSRTGLTKDDEMLGTPDYVAPEQVRDAKSADVRSDIYSLGCTFYFLLAGAPPFAADNVLELLAKHETEQPIPIRSLRPEVPANVADLLGRMIAKDPLDRPQSPQDIATALSPHGPSEITAGSSQFLVVDRSASREPDARRILPLARVLLSPVVLLPLLTVLISLVVLFAM